MEFLQNPWNIRWNSMGQVNILGLILMWCHIHMMILMWDYKCGATVTTCDVASFLQSTTTNTHNECRPPPTTTTTTTNSNDKQQWLPIMTTNSNHKWPPMNMNGNKCTQQRCNCPQSLSTQHTATTACNNCLQQRTTTVHERSQQPPTTTSSTQPNNNEHPQQCTSPYHILSENHGLGHKDNVHSSTYFCEKYII